MDRNENIRRFGVLTGVGAFALSAAFMLPACEEEYEAETPQGEIEVEDETGTLGTGANSTGTGTGGTQQPAEPLEPADPGM